MKSRIIAPFVLIALALIGVMPLAAQDAPDTGTKLEIVAESDSTITVRHEFGETEIPKNPQRVIAVTGTTELEALLVLDAKPIAAAGDDTDIGGTVWADHLKPLMDGIEMLPSRRNVNLELVLQAKPDLIIGSASWLDEIYDELSAIAPTIALDFGRPWQAVTRDVALLVNQTDRAEKFLADYDARIDALVQRYRPAVEGMTYTQIKSFISEGEIQLYGSTTNASPILNRLGMVQPAEQLEAAISAAAISPERIDLFDTDVIFLFHYPGPTEQQEMDTLAANPLFANLDAVKGSRVLPVISSWWYLGGAVGTQHLLDDLEQTVLPALAGTNGVTSTEVPVAQGAPLTLVDGEGIALTFDAPPERIVCVYTRCIELLAALEVAPVGATVSAEAFVHDPAYFPQPNDISLIDWDGDLPNMEQIAALKPDLVLGWAEMRAPLENVAPVYSVIDAQDSYQQSHDEIRAFARLLGREDVAEKNITAALNRLEAYKRLSPGNVSVMDMFFYNDTNYYRDGESGTCNLLKEVAMCDWPDPENSASWSVQINDEGLLQLDPDVIVISAYGLEGLTDAEILTKLSERPLWAELKAIQSKRIYVEPEGVNLDGMGTVSMSQMLDTFMPLLYPDVFPTPLTDEQVQEILAKPS